jgi:hypothetical protein
MTERRREISSEMTASFFRPHLAAVLSLLLAALLASGSTTAFAARPNAVIFLADDAGWGDYGHSGNRMVATPHIDSLARGAAAPRRTARTS